MHTEFPFPTGYISDVVRRSLEEDIGPGDLTAQLVPDVPVEARLVCRESAVLAGSTFFDEVFHQIDSEIEVHWQREDGQSTRPGEEICRLFGRSHPLLTGERSAINLLHHPQHVASINVNATGGLFIKIPVRIDALVSAIKQ